MGIYNEDNGMGYLLGYYPPVNKGGSWWLAEKSQVAEDCWENHP